MAVTRINNNQISDASAGNAYVGINAAVKLQNYTVTAQKLANNIVYGSDLTVAGNLTVQGNTTTIDTTYTTIEDPIILLASNQTGAPAVDIGYVGQRGTSNNIAFVWQESAQEFVTAYTTTGESNTVISISSYANLHVSNANIGGNMVVNGTTSFVGNILGNVSLAGNVTLGNVLTNGQVSAAGNVTGGNINTGGIVTATGNITSTANVSGGNLLATTTVSAVSVLGSVVSASANITGGNLLTGGQISSTGNISSAANIAGGNLIATSNVVAVGVSASGNVTGGNMLTSGQVSATGNISSAANIAGGNLNITSAVTASTVSASANITGGNILTGGIVSSTGNISSAGNISAGNLLATSNVNAVGGYFTGNVTVLGNLNASIGIVYANSGIFYGNTITGNSAIFAGIPGFTPLGSNVVAQFAGNANSYSQINFQNINTGTSASTDFIATADNGNDTSYYLDMGINSSTFNDASYAGFQPNDAYVHNHGGNLILNPESSGKVIKFMIGGTGNSDVIANISTTGYTSSGLISVVGNISSAANVAGGNVIASSNVTAAGVSASGNVTGGNLLTSGLISSTGNITTAGNIAGGNLILTGSAYTSTFSTTGNLFVGGNLTVQGNITYQNVDDLRVEDPVIIMGTGPNGSPLTQDDNMDRGIYMEYYVSGLGNAFVGWQNATGNLFAAANVNFSANNVVNVVEYGTFQAGNIYAQSALTTGNITGGNLLTGGLISATANITGGNILTGGQVSSTGNITSSANVAGGNLLTGGQVSSTGNITSAANVAGGNLIATTTVSAPSHIGTIVSVTANITGGNLLTGGQVSSTGNITSAANVAGGNVISSANVVAVGASISGNITGGNVLTSGIVSATGDITSAANVAGGNVIATTLVQGTTLSATGNVIGGNITTGGQVSATGNITSAANVAGGNLIATAIVSGASVLGTIVSASANITGGNILTGGLISATGNITSAANVAGGNVVSSANVVAVGVVASGNVSGGNLLTGGLISATGNISSSANISGANVLGTNVSASGNITGANINTGGTNGLTLNASTINSNAARITINSNGSDVDFAIDSDATANVFYVDAGTGTVSIGNSTQTTNAALAINATNSFLMPVGNTNQRPSTGVTGMLRFNTTLDAVEVYDADSWTTVGTPSFTIIADEQFTGNGVQTVFTLSSNAYTTNSVIVSINGVVQIPTTAYSVSGSSLTFTEAPQTGDSIDVRELTTTTQVTSISNSPANAVIAVSPTTAVVSVTGNLIPVSNNAQTLGSTTSWWGNIYGTSVNALYADLAEVYAADAEYAPGTVVSFGGTKEVTLSSAANDARIAGVVSTNPSYVMNATLESEYTVTVALTGRVPTLVSGPVAKGDMMVSGGNGRAVACATPTIGTVIGKALENHSGGDGTIEVVVGRL